MSSIFTRIVLQLSLVLMVPSSSAQNLGNEDLPALQAELSELHLRVQKLKEKIDTITDELKTFQSSFVYAYQQHPETERKRIEDVLDAFSNSQQKSLRRWSSCATSEKNRRHPNFNRCQNRIWDLEFDARVLAEKITDQLVLILSAELMEKRESSIHDAESQLSIIQTDYSATLKKRDQLQDQIEEIRKNVCQPSVGTVRLDSAEGSLRNAKVQQQGIGSCYANSVSLLYEAELGYPVSYLDLALSYKTSGSNVYRYDPNNSALKSDGDLMLEAGGSYKTIQSAKRRGVCPRKFSWMESEDFKHVYKQWSLFKALDRYFMNKNDVYDIELAILREILQKKMDPSLRESDKKNYVLKKLKEIQDHQCRSEVDQAAVLFENLLEQAGEANPGLDQFLIELEIKNQPQSDMDVVQALIAKECLDPKNRVDVSQYRAQSIWVDSKGTQESDLLYQAKVLELLKQGKPVALSTCSQILSNPKFVQSNQGNLKSSTCSPHALTITGYRWNEAKKSCEWMLWNSWGGKSNENWVDVKTVLNNNNDMTYLEKR